MFVGDRRIAITLYDSASQLQSAFASTPVPHTTSHYLWLLPDLAAQQAKLARKQFGVPRECSEPAPASAVAPVPAESDAEPASRRYLKLDISVRARHRTLLP